MVFRKKNVVEQESAVLHSEGGLDISMKNKNIGICCTVDTVCDEESTEVETETSTEAIN